MLPAQGFSTQRFCLENHPWPKVFRWEGSYHKRQISNPPTPLPPMFKNTKFQTRKRRYQPNLTLPNLIFDFGYYYWRLWMLAGTAFAVWNLAFVGAALGEIASTLQSPNFMGCHKHHLEMILLAFSESLLASFSFFAIDPICITVWGDWNACKQQNVWRVCRNARLIYPGLIVNYISKTYGLHCHIYV